MPSRLKGPDFPMGIETRHWWQYRNRVERGLKGPDFPMGIETPDSVGPTSTGPTAKRA